MLVALLAPSAAGSCTKPRAGVFGCDIFVPKLSDEEDGELCAYNAGEKVVQITDGEQSDDGLKQAHILHRKHVNATPDAIWRVLYDFDRLIANTGTDMLAFVTKYPAPPSAPPAPPACDPPTDCPIYVRTVSKPLLGGLVPAQTVFVANTYDRRAGLVEWSFDQACQVGGEAYGGCQVAGGECHTSATRNDGCWRVEADPRGGSLIAFMNILEVQFASGIIESAARHARTEPQTTTHRRDTAHSRERQPHARLPHAAGPQHGERRRRDRRGRLDREGGKRAARRDAPTSTST